MSWDLSGSDYDKITMVLNKLGYSTEDGLYEAHVALGTEDTLVVSCISDENSSNRCITTVPLEYKMNSYTMLDDFYCVVAKHDNEVYFEFISLIDELKAKVKFLMNHEEHWESEQLYFITGEEITPVFHKFLNKFLDARIQAEEEADARFREAELNGDTLKWLEEGLK